MAMETLEQTLARYTREGALYEKLPDGALRCFACGHRCLIREGHRGVCLVRFNEGGVLKVPFGYVGALQCDPVEKKPFFHVLPGTDALSFGMLGCDFHCGYCQNWLTSQALRDPNAGAPPHPMTAEELVKAAELSHAPMLASTYNEPLITSEWAMAVFRLAKSRGLKTAYISNGNATEEVLQYIRPHLDCYKIDFKSHNAQHYRAELGGQLETILWTIRRVHELGLWLEIVTLIIPGFNDSDDELRQIAAYVASVSRDIPWHVTAFHSDYKMAETGNTPPETLLRAAAIGEQAGLRYVYAGNLPGRVGRYEDTRCPSCKTAVIERTGYTIRANRLVNGCCPSCQTLIPGRWS